MTANFVASAAQQLNAKQVAARKLLTVQRPGTTVEQRLHHRHHHRAWLMVRNVGSVIAALEPAAADPIHTRTGTAFTVEQDESQITAVHDNYVDTKKNLADMLTKCLTSHVRSARVQELKCVRRT